MVTRSVCPVFCVSAKETSTTFKQPHESKGACSAYSTVSPAPKTLRKEPILNAGILTSVTPLMTICLYQVRAKDEMQAWTRLISWMHAECTSSCETQPRQAGETCQIFGVHRAWQGQCDHGFTVHIDNECVRGNDAVRYHKSCY